jgi:hypothetical protein
MSIITIQCRLVASEETRRHLWEMMAQQNTPLINDHSDQGWVESILNVKMD